MREESLNRFTKKFDRPLSHTQTHTFLHMRLTKHLYRFEEVRSAFLYTIRCRRHVEACFWLEELEESCYSGEARRLLFVAWFLFIGLGRLHWLLYWSTVGHLREGRQLLCIQLCTCTERESSLWMLIASNVLPPPSLPLVQSWRSFQTGVNPTLTHLNDTRLVSIVHALATDMKGYACFGKATLFGIQSFWKQISQSSWLPFSSHLRFTEIIASWRELTMRKRRVYTIPYDCLFGMTWRGMGGDTTNELQNLTKEVFQQSSYWKVKACWETDEEKEKFYQTYFPDDIPDEWSREDQEKSHGAPGFGSVDSPLGRWWRNWIPAEASFVPSALVANCRAWVSQQTIGNHGSVLDRFLSIQPDS